ncbi:MAG: lysine--tRNA ligase [Firmicutes bacterium]|nr:lysine--tRNA ligase [Bacillota bacterium]
MADDLTEQEQVRREKLPKYELLGVDPFGQKFVRSDTSATIKEKCLGKTHEELDAAQVFVSIAGRLMAVRRMGKASFFNMQDKFGTIQCYIKKDVVGDPTYELFDLADLGDIVGVYGRVMLTHTGELTVRVEKYTHLVKALRPLPDKFHGLVDVEERARRRYVDLIVNDEARRIALLRPRIIRSIQNYLDGEGFVEFETSVLQPTLGGAAARPFVTHHNTLDRDFYLRIATELPLKRLLVGGLERAYEIGRLFRNEGMDSKHNPEFTTVEAYQAYGDIVDMQNLAENLIRKAALDAVGTTLLPWGEKVIDVGAPFKKIHMVDLIKEVTGIDFWVPMTFEEAEKIAKTHEIHLEKHENSVGYVINEFFEKYCEKTIVQPTFVFGHPLEISPLAKKSKDARFTERFELFIDGSEYANAFTELNNPIDQQERFNSQLMAKALGDAEASEMDVDFVEALEYGMPPAGGIGIGIDRLVMLLTNTHSIREVILFPCMRDR